MPSPRARRARERTHEGIFVGLFEARFWWIELIWIGSYFVKSLDGRRESAARTTERPNEHLTSRRAGTEEREVSGGGEDIRKERKAKTTKRKYLYF